MKTNLASNFGPSVPFLLFCYLWICAQEIACYSNYTLDDDENCNRTFYLGEGEKSKAILKLTSKKSYDTRPRFCTVTFVVPVHKWSGLTAVIEEMDLRKYIDVDHHLAQDVCVDYIKVEPGAANSSPVHEQCGTWAVTPDDELPKFGPKRALIGYCPRRSGNSKKCQVTKLTVQVSIGGQKRQAFLWRNTSWGVHKGFTIVITAYSYPTQNGETECREGLKSCSQGGSASNLGENHCIHDSLWCDGHVNCGMQLKMDEAECVKKGFWDLVLPRWFAPSIASSFFIVLSIFFFYYFMRSKNGCSKVEEPTNADMTSYAESYELSSNLSSSHHMAIQVRVVCNSNHPHHSGLNRLSQWKPDLPPAYDSLFPTGPPEVFNSPSNVTTSIIATVEGASAVGVNVTSISTTPQASVTNMTQPDPGTSTSSALLGTSSIVSSREGIPVTPASQMSANNRDLTSIIDLNVIQNRNIASTPNKKVERRSGSEVDASFAATTSQTSVTVTVTPNTQISNSSEQRQSAADDAHCAPTKDVEANKEALSSPLRALEEEGKEGGQQALAEATVPTERGTQTSFPSLGESEEPSQPSQGDVGADSSNRQTV